MNPNSNHSNLLEQNSAIFVFNPNCVRYLKRQTYGKAVHSSENTTKIFSDFYKREQHQKSKKIAEQLRPLRYDFNTYSAKAVFRKTPKLGLQQKGVIFSVRDYCFHRLGVNLYC